MNLKEDIRATVGIRSIAIDLHRRQQSEHFFDEILPALRDEANV
jgi:hypothetical protein